uniref:Cytochrome P450, family 2, subfamily Y, polypeptide 3 n=1 Tax=Sphaeramia orbicularis TaxID=375764 RepID=A0A673BVF5_9TELE
MGVLDTVVLAALVFALLWVLLLRGRRKWHLPPGPSSVPIIGNLLQLDPKAPYNSLLKFSERYGPVVTLYLGPQRVVVLIGYEAVKEALVDQAEDFIGRGPFPFLVKVTDGYGTSVPHREYATRFHVALIFKDFVLTSHYLRKGLAVSNGERWKQLRQFTLTTLRDFGMGRKRMEQWIQEESKHLVARIDSTKGKYVKKHNSLKLSSLLILTSFSPASPFDPTYFLSCTVSNVICCLVFGQRFSYDDDHFLQLLQIVSALLKFASSPWCQLYNVFPRLMEYLPGRHHKVFGRVETLKRFIKKKIREHEETLEPSSPRDYIDCFLIRLNKEKDLSTSEFHYDNLVSTVFNLYMGGTESTSSTIRFALSVLSKYPEIQEKMQQEIDSVIGQERDPFMEDRKSLPFTDAVIHEIQRFMDIVPMGAPRYALHDISFRGYTIPKVLGGTIILPVLHSVLKEKKHWATPFSFNPEHFLDHNGNFKKNPSFLPFAAGKRACAGESLARMELFIFLVSLLQNFTFFIPGGPDGIDLSPEYSSFANIPRTYEIIATPRRQ